jgi:hypothetical protein
VSPFLTRLAARATAYDPSLMPRPRSRFADRPTAAVPQSLPLVMEGAALPISPERASRNVRVEPGPRAAPNETGISTAVSVINAGAPPEATRNERSDIEAPYVSERLLPLTPLRGKEVGYEPAIRAEPQPIADVDPFATSADGSRAEIRKMAARLDSGRGPTDGLQPRQSRQLRRTWYHSAHQPSPQAQEAPVIVHIGRIDVRAVHPQPPAPPPPTRNNAARKPSLQNYLRDREGGRK